MKVSDKYSYILCMKHSHKSTVAEIPTVKLYLTNLTQRQSIFKYSYAVLETALMILMTITAIIIIIIIIIIVTKVYSAIIVDFPSNHCAFEAELFFRQIGQQRFGPPAEPTNSQPVHITTKTLPNESRCWKCPPMFRLHSGFSVHTRGALCQASEGF